jgi:hypothetical protein
MDLEEILEYSSKLIARVGTDGEDLFSLGSQYQRVVFFGKLRELLQQKIDSGDEIATEVLAWAWIELAL